jgi:D-aminoacyl-tRNA deacylase
MRDEAAIICSRSDPAGQNIADRLQELRQWTEEDGYLSSGPWRMVIHDERQTMLQGLDARLNMLGLEPEVVVFASRHEAKAGLPWLGGHFTGIVDGAARELSAASAWGLRSFLQNVANMAPEGFRVSAEATHHGPTDMRTPCFFAEIGSSEPMWRDCRAGEAVAGAILGLRRQELPVFLGFGGGHYVQRQTELMREAKIAFGHLFSSYQAGFLDADLMDDARRKSGAGYAYMDRKSLPSADRKRIAGILEELGIPLLRGREIRDRFPQPERDREDAEGRDRSGK